jgi:glycosyltransferase involved in cell wall biosynthesis
LASGTSGGVEQFILGLASGLSQLDDGDEEYVFLAWEDAADWLTPHLGPACRILWDGVGPKPTSTWRRLARRIPLAGRARDEWLPLVGPLRPTVPSSNGRIEREGVDVMHFTTQSGFLTSVPSMYHPHDLQHLHLPEYFTRRSGVVREVTYRRLCAQADMVAVASSWVKQDLVSSYHLSPDKIRVIPLAPPVQAYPEPSETDLERVRSELGLPENFLLYPAQTWPHKNHLTLLRALASSRERHGLQISLVCSGQTTPYLRTIEAEAERLSLARQVQFVGFVSPVELQSLYRLCRAVVVPTMFEAGSFPMAEAFSVGAPVACSNVTSLPAQAGDAALLFDPRDAEQIAEAVRRLWTDPKLRRTLVARGHERIRSSTWRETARIFRAHYHRIAGRELQDDDRELVAASG